MTKGQAWIDRGESLNEAQRSARELQFLKRKAKALGDRSCPRRHSRELTAELARQSVPIPSSAARGWSRRAAMARHVPARGRLELACRASCALRTVSTPPAPSRGSRKRRTPRSAQLSVAFEMPRKKRAVTYGKDKSADGVSGENAKNAKKTTNSRERNTPRRSQAEPR